MMEPKQQLEVLNYAMQEVAGTKFIVAGIIKAFNSMAQFTYPVCVAQILSYIEDPASGSFGAALTWAFILAFCSFAKAVLENLCAFRHKARVKAKRTSHVATSCNLFLVLNNLVRSQTTTSRTGQDGSSGVLSPRPSFRSRSACQRLRCRPRQ